MGSKPLCGVAAWSAYTSRSTIDTPGPLRTFVSSGADDRSPSQKRPWRKTAGLVKAELCAVSVERLLCEQNDFRLAYKNATLAVNWHGVPRLRVLGMVIVVGETADYCSVSGYRHNSVFCRWRVFSRGEQVEPYRDLRVSRAIDLRACTHSDKRNGRARARRRGGS